MRPPEIVRTLPVTRGGGASASLSMRLATPEGTPRSPGILYLHGFGSAQAGEKADFFREQALAAGYRFASFDFRGHGKSGGNLSDLTLSRNLEDVELVRAELGWERFALIGSSMGGATALWYAAQHPQRVAAALLIAPALEMEKGLLTWAGPERTARWQREGTIRFDNGFVESDLAWPLIEDLRRYPRTQLQEQLQTPTLIFQGRMDASVPYADVVDFVARCRYRRIELRLYADGDHRLTDRKEDLWRGMAEWLGRVG
ncbi:MAG TPA: alpha/beta hydrolase [Thermoanaerobaculia bacterium]|nr:alpha/beta hydrolase [Thermoanaerobaculia bacterium]